METATIQPLRTPFSIYKILCLQPIPPPPPWKGLFASTLALQHHQLTSSVMFPSPPTPHKSSPSSVPVEPENQLSLIFWQLGRQQQTVLFYSIALLSTLLHFGSSQLIYRHHCFISSVGANANALVYTKLAHGLSGGERRRISIGLSLLHDPAVLLLDEPTSGLDSTSAFHVMQILRSIAASRHRTVVLSIHQPSFKILSTIDRFLLLSKGTVVQHGTLSSLQAFLNSNGFTVAPQLNALEYAMEILNQLHDSKPITPPSLLPSPQESIVAPNNNEAIDIRYRSSRLHEIYSLYNRFWKIIYRTRQLLLTNALEALIVGLVLSTIYINIGYDKEGIEKRLGLFAFTLTFLLSSTTETLRIFLNERPILLRETSSGVYRLSSYLIAKYPCLLAISAFHCDHIFNLCLLPSGSMCFMASFCLLRFGHLDHCSNGEFICPLLELSYTKLYSRNVACNGTSGLFFPLLRLLHLQG
ncbi:ABC transporter G family member 4 [Hibiscus syriacus]|uniref:ABC transporter G family member 4 n=1 Tax=Hibiscus syriacus TaxID=106335 RepID=A0A6A2YFM8_HIBSY|nr:ABC transporter G family member 4 [Hibiscus syriacus]